ncbi:V-type proton ATPase subunit B [Geodia barretti]|uniref:V-type proton ATPase subunit B n=1 Tax=Geodia barretti TaxID=519541 RepID=A0AA35WT07_GEOBA|nr:V-type proton ATPase subunit B [Geodia barretti]
MATPQVATSREHALAVTRDYISQPRLTYRTVSGVNGPPGYSGSSKGEGLCEDCVTTTGGQFLARPL